MPLTRQQLEERLIALQQASLQLVGDISLETLLERIANVACEQAQAQYAAVTVLFFVLAVPFAWIFLLPPLHYRPTEFDIVIGCILIGLNALAWGYGLAAMICWLPKQVRDVVNCLRGID